MQYKQHVQYIHNVLHMCRICSISSICRCAAYAIYVIYAVHAVYAVYTVQTANMQGWGSQGALLRHDLNMNAGRRTEDAARCRTGSKLKMPHCQCKDAAFTDTPPLAPPAVTVTYTQRARTHAHRRSKPLEAGRTPQPPLHHTPHTSPYL